MATSDREQIRAVVKGLEELTERTIIKIVLDIVANLQEATPVLTGWARANWVPSLTRPFDQVAGSAAEAKQGTLDLQPQQTGMAEVLGYRLRAGSVFVSNNVPYITRLNEGHSQKAPAGFVQDAIEKAVTQDIKNL